MDGAGEEGAADIQQVRFALLILLVALVVNGQPPTLVGGTNGFSNILVTNYFIITHTYEVEYETNNWETIGADPTNLTVLHQASLVFSHTNIVFVFGGVTNHMPIPNTRRYFEVDCLPQRTITVGAATVQYHGRGWSVPTKP